MTQQFKHEEEGYVPIKSANGTPQRPWWMDDDKLLMPGSKIVIKQINELTKDEFIKYQKEGRIPKNYKIEDWLE